MSLLSSAYAAGARQRRLWYASRPDRRRRLVRPVISVGNVAVGGSAKTPVVAWLARLLADMGERPSILTRGYARSEPCDGVTVVSDGERMLADLDRAGDEPLMLARQLPRVPVLVAADRHLAGLLAERRLGCTVHLLDDGFQHFQLERDVDLVLVTPEDVEKRETLPSGRLREPIDVARGATAVIAVTADQEQAAAVADAVGAAVHFRLRRFLDRPRLIEPAGRVVAPAAGTRVLAVAGLARPDRFFVDLAQEGWTVADHLVFRDHHRYTTADVGAIAAAMRAARAVMVMTTEKDLVRLLPLRPLPVPVAWVPMQVSVEPAAEFRSWIAGRLKSRDEERRTRDEGKERAAEFGLGSQAVGRRPD